MPEPASERFIRMTCAPVETLVCGLAGPSIMIMVVSALYNMADTYFVGSLGTSAVAAVGIGFPLMAIIQAMGFFFGQGSGNYIARALGARETENASRMAATGLVSGFMVMALIALAALAALGPLTGLLGATPTIRPFAVDYLFFVLLAAPWMVAATVLNQQLRFQGSAAIAMTGMISGAALNIALDPLFIFVFGLGIKGAAIATMISQMTSFCILLAFGSSRGGNIAIKLRHFSPSPARYAEMFHGGIPALLRQGLLSVSTIVINHFAGVYGDAAIAAISIANRLFMFANALMLGFGQGFQPVCGFNYGAKLYERVKKAFWFCVRLAATGLLIISVVMAIFAPYIIGIFRKDPDVIRIGASSLRLHCISLPLNAWIIICNMMTQTMGKSLQASLLALARQGLFLLPALCIFTPILGLPGIQMSLPVSDILAFCFSIPLTARVLRVDLRQNPALE